MRRLRGQGIAQALVQARRGNTSAFTGHVCGSCGATLGDDIGSLSPGDANAAYALAWRLREQATTAAEAFKSLSSVE